jgi:hypothetical protein
MHDEMRGKTTTVNEIRKRQQQSLLNVVLLVGMCDGVMAE